jgi:hypothetical protein
MLNADRCPWAIVAVVINSEYDWNLRVFEIGEEPAVEERIEADVARFFHDYYDQGIMPPFEPLRDAELIKYLYPRDDGTEIDLSADNRAIIAVEELTETKAALSRLEKTETALIAELTAKLGPHTYGRLADGRRLSWRQQHRSVKAYESTFRVLRILNKEKQKETP